MSPANRTKRDLVFYPVSCESFFSPYFIVYLRFSNVRACIDMPFLTINVNTRNTFLTANVKHYVLLCRRILGLPHLIEVDCTHPWLLELVPGIKWPAYLSVAFVAVLYFILAIEVRRRQDKVIYRPLSTASVRRRNRMSYNAAGVGGALPAIIF